MLRTPQNVLTEWSFRAASPHPDPFQQITLDVQVTDARGRQQRVPAFWAGGDLWKVRYASPHPGRYRWESVCSDTTDAGLHGITGELEIIAYTGTNPLLVHGPVRRAGGQRYLEHADGVPFFWLADTWWMGFCDRLSWPADFQTLTADRVAKGFTVVQIVAGLYPDMPAFDPRGANEAGFPWEEAWTRINPAYFDQVDLRMFHLVEQGLTPCLLGCWGYYLQELGVERMQQHWRYLIARYGALPVVWCLAGEGAMPYYLSPTKEADRQAQIQGWTELARYVRAVDPYDRLLTIHPTDASTKQLNERALLDLDMLQTGHGDRGSIPRTLRLLAEARERQPALPVLNSEVCYEGIGEACRQEIQRFMFWACVLSGACGHTYGANGIWQVNRTDLPYGPSPHGMSWGHTSWQEAAALPGSTQTGLGKRLLMRYPWWRFAPHPEWVDEPASADDWARPFAAGVPGEIRLFFLPSGVWGIRLRQLEPEVDYRAFLFSPVDGSEVDLGDVSAQEDGSWRIPRERPPIFQDWVLILECAHA